MTFRLGVFLLLAALLLSPGAATAWGNKKTHPELTNAAVNHAAEFDQALREVYGVFEERLGALGERTILETEAGGALVEELRAKTDLEIDEVALEAVAQRSRRGEVQAGSRPPSPGRR